MFISSDLASNSYALDGTNLNSEVTAEIDGTHYVTLSASDVTFSIAPTNSTASDKKQVSVDLSTNVSGGASLYLSTSSSKNALYLNGDTNSTSKNIASASSTTTYDNMVNNTWAYSTDDINYQGVPTLDSPVLLSDIDGISTGTNTNGVVSASIPIYYAAKVDTSIPSGSYANSVTYLAVVDGGIVTSATLTSIAIDGENTDPMKMQTSQPNTILVTTNLKTNAYGTPRVYYTTTSPSGYAECGNVVVASNAEGYMTIQCETTPTTVATGLTLHIVPKGSSEDTFCTDGTYEANSSECEAGDWKWGSFTVELPDIAPPPIPLMEQTYMQDMTPGGCAISSEGDTKQLIDKRDGKTYWVAKLADGNCWMTQNLELDLAGKTLTPEDSDVSSSWTYNGSWYTSASQGSDDLDVIQGWDLGEYIKTNPTDATECNRITALSACPTQYASVSGMLPFTEAVNEGKSPSENVAISGSQYDAHYLVGNYYSWGAATASSGNDIVESGDAVDSICPVGWHLPLGGSTHRDNPGSFYYLLEQYGLTSRTASNNNNIATSPLYFVRSGIIWADAHYVYGGGRLGLYWSGHKINSKAYFVYFNASYVYPNSVDWSRFTGQPVRCVAPSA